MKFTQSRISNVLKFLAKKHYIDYWYTLSAILVVLFTSVQLLNSVSAEENLASRSLPLQNYSLQLATSMDEQKAALIRYLVEGDTRHKNTYEEMEVEIEDLVRKMILITDRPEEESIIQQVDWLMDELDAGGRLVLSMDESVDRNYLEISESIDDIDDLMDQEVAPYVDGLHGKRREKLEEIAGELETSIQEVLLALAEYLLQGGAEESKLEFLEARANIQLWENQFIENAETVKERRWARLLNENMDNVILKADELILNFDRRMEEYTAYSQMEVDADNYIEKNLLALGNRLVESDISRIKKDKNWLFSFTLLVLLVLIFVMLIQNRNRLKRKDNLKKMELKHRDSQMNAILQSQEKERSRYAQDLHDSYGQLIAVLKLNLQSLERKMGDLPDGTSKMFKHSNSVLQTMSDSLRRICFGLMPVTLEQRGLKEALQELAYNINVTGTINVDIKVNMILELDRNHKILIFRICQEWLNNILKHSNAGVVKIELDQKPGNILLTIQDDGKGFDKKRLFDGTGLGWKNIQSRARILGAQVTIKSDTNKLGSRFALSMGKPERLSIYALGQGMEHDRSMDSILERDL